MELAEKVLNNLKEDVKEKGLKWSITEGGKEGKSEVIYLLQNLEEELRACRKKGVVMADSVETLGVSLRTHTHTHTHRAAVSEGECEKKCDVRFSLIKKIRVRNGLVLARGWGRTSGRCCTHRKVQIEEADGGSSRQEGIGIACLVLRGE